MSCDTCNPSLVDSVRRVGINAQQVRRRVGGAIGVRPRRNGHVDGEGQRAAACPAQGGVRPIADATGSLSATAGHPATRVGVRTERLEAMLAHIGVVSGALVAISAPTLTLACGPSSPRFTLVADRMAKVMPNAVAEVWPPQSPRAAIPRRAGAICYPPPADLESRSRALGS
jgi:hypothetical protein